MFSRTDTNALHNTSPPDPAANLVAIGASAGGPVAIAAILNGLPPDFPAAIIIVQHIDGHFSELTADWLNSQSRLPVRLARNHDQPRKGVVLLARGEQHLVFTGPHRLGYTVEPADCMFRPSIDVFFESMARYWRGGAGAVLLTGMGKDGAAGLKRLRDSGVSTTAQDRDSSLVYGMPKAAARIGAARQILPLSRIAPSLIALFRPGGTP